jgi:hypothetical protein
MGGLPRNQQAGPQQQADQVGMTMGMATINYVAVQRRTARKGIFAPPLTFGDEAAELAAAQEKRARNAAYARAYRRRLRNGAVPNSTHGRAISEGIKLARTLTPEQRKVHQRKRAQARTARWRKRQRNRLCLASAAE